VFQISDKNVFVIGPALTAITKYISTKYWYPWREKFRSGMENAHQHTPSLRGVACIP